MIWQVINVRHLECWGPEIKELHAWTYPKINTTKDFTVQTMQRAMSQASADLQLYKMLEITIERI